MLMKLAQNSNEWRKFSGALWKHQIDVRDFIVSNVTPYTGGPEFLAKPTSERSPSGKRSSRSSARRPGRACSTSTWPTPRR